MSRGRYPGGGERVRPLVESLHGDHEWRGVWLGRGPWHGRRGAGCVPVQVRAEPRPADHFWTQLSAYHEFGREPIPGLVRATMMALPVAVC
jgi:hypothetical protein